MNAHEEVDYLIENLKHLNILPKINISDDKDNLIISLLYNNDKIGVILVVNGDDTVLIATKNKNSKYYTDNYEITPLSDSISQIENKIKTIFEME